MANRIAAAFILTVLILIVSDAYASGDTGVNVGAGGRALLRSTTSARKLLQTNCDEEGGGGGGGGGGEECTTGIVLESGA